MRVCKTIWRACSGGPLLRLGEMLATARLGFEPRACLSGWRDFLAGIPNNGDASEPPPPPTPSTSASTESGHIAELTWSFEDENGETSIVTLNGTFEAAIGRPELALVTDGRVPRASVARAYGRAVEAAGGAAEG